MGPLGEVQYEQPGPEQPEQGGVEVMEGEAAHRHQHAEAFKCWRTRGRGPHVSTSDTAGGWGVPTPHPGKR